MITFDVPNLDDASVDPADYRELAKVFGKLESICRRKASSIQSRLDGDIKDAKAMEECNERFYDSLPAWAQW